MSWPVRNMHFWHLSENPVGRIMNDTSPEIAAMVHARTMAKTGEERFLMGIRMH